MEKCATRRIMGFPTTYRHGFVALSLSILAITFCVYDWNPVPLQPHVDSRELFQAHQTIMAAPTNALEELHYALETMQNFYFQ
jgi:hypothetical protein